MTTPEALRDEGMAAAENAADPRVILAIDAAIERAIESGQRFSVNDIRDQFPTVTSTGLVGDRFSRMAKRRPRRMIAVGREPSTLPSTHAAEVKVWIGAAHHEAVAS